MKSLYTEIEIDASADIVWEILTDFDSYPDWNPFIRSFDGHPKPGHQFSVTIQPTGKKPMSFKPVCLSLIPESEFRWLGHLFISGLFDGEHIFELKELSDTRTLLIQRENFQGLLVPLLWRQLNTSTRSGFEQMNQELKKRAESQATV
ncbi:SRPBCC domain-containing protein [Rhodohalobacter sp. 8-1]|uniref:SRPBCC domain-containing protein n=1 Tax=Rhodohalobacter sp. 8-1 TaxID=3131972 RepID=UPI0030EE1654